MMSTETRSLLGRIMLVCVLGLATVPAYSADTGCDDSGNDRINPMLALCSTHAYNAGQTKNQTSSAEKQLMRDIVALKTTVMMQQMYKQYEFLDATLSRMKTQLQREVLTTNLQAAGASSGAASGTGALVSGNNGVSGAENCRTAGSTSDVMSCLSRNLDRIITAINNADIGAARRQIETDLQTLRLYDQLAKDADDPMDDAKNDKSMSQPLATAYSQCNSAQNDVRQMLECTDYIRVCITRNIEHWQKQSSGGSNMMMMMR